MAPGFARAFTAPLGAFPHRNPLENHQVPAAMWKETSTVPARKLLPALRAMMFWNRILKDAMAQFTEDSPSVPKDLTEKPGYCPGIRGLDNWDDIHGKLQEAREKFDSKNSKFLGRAKKVYRCLIDKSSVAKQALKALPDIEYLSPVKASVEVLLDAAKVASTVREEVGSSFDEKDLEKTFGKVELFLSTFPDDDNIKGACVRLVACILKAVEDTIVYFLSHAWRRLQKSLPFVGDGENYNQDLLTSIKQIPVKCQELVDEALNSHIEGTKKAINMVLEGIDKVVLLERIIDNGVQIVIERTDRIEKQGGQVLLMMDRSKEDIKRTVQEGTDNLAKTLRKLLEQGQREGEKSAEQQRRRDEEVMQKLESLEVKIQVVQQDKDEARNRTLALISTPPPQLHQLHGWYSPQPQWTWSSPGQHLWQPQSITQPQYQQKYHSPYQWPNMPRQVTLPPIHRISPPPAPDQSPPEPTVYVDDLLCLLNILDLDASDIASILDTIEYTGIKYRSQAKGVITTEEFRTWATSPKSCELLIQGDSSRDIIQAGPGLSIVSASLMQGLRKTYRFSSLVFFCRHHSESDDPFTGPSALLRSFITQLIKQYFANCLFLQRDLDIEGLCRGDVGALCGLFARLVRQLPQEETLVCVVDAVEVYERTEYEVELRVVMGCLLRLARDFSLLPTVKILATSPGGTVSLHEDFSENDMSILLLEGLVSGGDAQGMLELEEEL